MGEAATISFLPPSKGTGVGSGIYRNSSNSDLFATLPGNMLAPTKQLGLHDTARVQVITSRGELQQPNHPDYNKYVLECLATEYRPTSRNVDDLLNEIGNEFDDCLDANTTLDTRSFIPNNRLFEILTPERVRDIVHSLECFQDLEDKDGLVQDICVGSHLRLLAVLVGIRKVDYLLEHMDDGMCDLCLPMPVQKDRRDGRLYCQYHRESHKSLDSYPRISHRKDFSQWSYSLSAPYITYDARRHQHYSLSIDDILPMRAVAGKPRGQSKEAEEANSSYGGFSQVFKVELDKSHYDFGDVGIRHPDGFFALKKLLSRNYRDFNLELASLLFSMDNCEGEGSKHIINLLATFEVQDPSVQHSTYYFLFDWADGTLDSFWRTAECLVGDRTHYKWMSEQFYGICLALQSVHNERGQSPGPIGGDALEGNFAVRSHGFQELYGRHGDIKPDNILWFRSGATRGDLGTLALADFGLGRLHTQVSRSNRDPMNIPRTATYRAPEFDVPGTTISRASDIFSLGCVFLEHVTWHLRGLESVTDGFPDHRMETDIYDFEADTFFSVRDHKPVRKESITMWIADLRKHTNCNEYIRELLDVIEYGMLEPESAKRIGINALVDRMADLRRIKC
ncbi:protein kinase [Durotheca rogersii]|uniref:protein kinase n=1 Tax=Durotheca rogersii TaxID=419775 RepID=UPI0022207121|nr:protein kinase [Durotheca rogersii]KAI5860609.1 protein kinase [Durotheca rogersii]